MCRSKTVQTDVDAYMEVHTEVFKFVLQQKLIQAYSPRTENQEYEAAMCQSCF